MRFIHYPMYIVFLTLVSLGAGQGSMAAAMESKSVLPAPDTLQQSYVWYDGERERTVWLNPALMAEFVTAANAKASAQTVLPGAKLVANRGGVRLWQVEQGAQVPTPAAGLQGGAGQRLSPVLHDMALPHGRKRALPGNVIVYLDPHWDQPTIDAWVQRQGLTVVEKLSFGTNIYVFKTAPGLVGLELANRLYRSGEVVSAFPNWWQESVPR